MTEATKGGLDGDPLEALTPPAQVGGCCGTSVDATASAAPAATSGGCCG